MEGTKCKVGFGTAEPRMTKWALHPNLDSAGAYSRKCLGQDVQRYHPQDIKEIYKVNKDYPSSPWAVQATLKEWSENLGFRYQCHKYILDKKEDVKKRGPAGYLIKDYVCQGSVCENVGFGLGERIPKRKCEKLPPGRYHPHPLPRPHTKVETFDWSDPCRFKDITPSWSVAPNRYKMKGSIEVLRDKVVSLRGPYDLFTPLRNEASVKNHFGLGPSCASASFPIALPGCLELLKKKKCPYMQVVGWDTPDRARIAMNNLAQVKRKPSEPGPDHYNIVDKKYVFKQNTYGFNSSVPVGLRTRVRRFIWPGVGRYIFPEQIKKTVCNQPIGHGYKYLFKSKVPRSGGLVIQKPMNSF